MGLDRGTIGQVQVRLTSLHCGTDTLYGSWDRNPHLMLLERYVYRMLRRVIKSRKLRKGATMSSVCISSAAAVLDCFVRILYSGNRNGSSRIRNFTRQREGPRYALSGVLYGAISADGFTRPQKRGCSRLHECLYSILLSPFSDSSDPNSRQSIHHAQQSSTSESCALVCTRSVFRAQYNVSNLV